ncbi:MAG: hypothetical protein SOS98_02120 [Varibaculum sp.]|nr:hypothetical protein [Varibaculum sp.]
MTMNALPELSFRVGSEPTADPDIADLRPRLRPGRLVIAALVLVGLMLVALGIFMNLYHDGSARAVANSYTEGLETGDWQAISQALGGQNIIEAYPAINSTILASRIEAPTQFEVKAKQIRDSSARIDYTFQLGGNSHTLPVNLVRINNTWFVELPAAAGAHAQFRLGTGVKSMSIGDYQVPVGAFNKGILQSAILPGTYRIRATPLHSKLAGQESKASLGFPDSVGKVDVTATGTRGFETAVRAEFDSMLDGLDGFVGEVYPTFRIDVPAPDSGNLTWAVAGRGYDFEVDTSGRPWAFIADKVPLTIGITATDMVITNPNQLARFAGYLDLDDTGTITLTVTSASME